MLHSTSKSLAISTMKRTERQQKLHNSLINMLYASPSPSSPPQQNQFDDETLEFAREIVNSDSHRINTDELEVDEEGSSSASSEEQGELGFQKLTRAQRKRLRRKKLKEAASQRRKIIGPQLPPDDQIDGHSEGVRPNAAERLDNQIDRNQLPPDDEIDSHSEGVRRNAVERPEGQTDHDYLSLDDQIDGHSEGDRRNAAESRNDHDHRGESSSCIKVKHRRMSKKKARDKPETPTTDCNHGGTNHGA